MQETLSELCGKKFRRQKKSDDRGPALIILPSRLGGCLTV